MLEQAAPTLHTLRVSCPKCAAPQAFGLRMDRRQRPYCCCETCGLKTFARSWAPADPFRLMAVGLFLGSRDGHRTIEQLMVQLGFARTAGPQPLEEQMSSLLGRQVPAEELTPAPQEEAS